MKLEELLNVESFTIGDQEFENDVRDAIEIDSSNLEIEFARHTKLVAVYGFAYEQAAAYSSKLKVDLERAYATLDSNIREDAAVLGQKISEKTVESKVKVHPKYMELQDKLLGAEREEGNLKAAKDAMSHRRDMLLQLGQLERALMKSEPSLKY